MSGFWQERLDHLKSVIEADVEKGLYFGAVLRVMRGGVIGFDEAIGYADGNKTKPLAKDSVFSIFSTTKAFTNILILRAIEMGRFALTTKVSEVLPEFAGEPRNRATFFHLLSHTAGMPGVWMPRPDMYLDRLDELFQAVIENVHGAVEPGTRCDYSPLANHVLMGEALRRTDPKGRRFQDILREDLFEPLGMRDTSMGLRADLNARHVRPDMRGTVPIKHLSRNLPGDHALFEDRPLRRDAPARRRAGRRPHPLAPHHQDGAASAHRPVPQRALPHRSSAHGLGGDAGLYGPRLQRAWHRDRPSPARHDDQPGDLRQLWRGERHVLGRSRAGCELHLSHRGGHDPGRQHRALPAAVRSGDFGVRMNSLYLTHRSP
ncbi:MAG: beta-lactamase family protein [Sphingomonadales bacterium]|nr:beta-lactamase family protein [Sphingomonadales bacterium]